MISSINGNGNDLNLMQLLINSANGLSNIANASNNKELSKTDNGENDFLNCLQANFNKVDANSDKTLSKDEVQAFMKENKPMGPPPGMVIEKMEGSDTNSAQSIGKYANGKEAADAADKTKLEEAFEDYMKKLDKNEDGVISEEELEAAKAEKTKNDSTKKTDALSDIWKQFSGSDLSKNLMTQFSKKATEIYNSAMSGNTISNVANILT